VKSDDRLANQIVKQIFCRHSKCVKANFISNTITNVGVSLYIGQHKIDPKFMKFVVSAINKSSSRISERDAVLKFIDIIQKYKVHASLFKIVQSGANNVKDIEPSNVLSAAIFYEDGIEGTYVNAVVNYKYHGTAFSLVNLTEFSAKLSQNNVEVIVEGYDPRSEIKIKRGHVYKLTEDAFEAFIESEAYYKEYYKSYHVSPAKETYKRTLSYGNSQKGYILFLKEVIEREADELEIYSSGRTVSTDGLLIAVEVAK